MKRFFILSKVVIITILTLFASCATTSHQVLLGDVISFGDDARTSYSSQKNGKGKQYAPYVLYSPGDYITKLENAKQEQDMRDFIDDTEMESNTAGIFAMDLALDRIKYVQKHQLKRDPSAKYYIIYMTDGLDNISVQVAKNNGRGNFKTPEKYKKKMAKKIAKISGWKKKHPNQFDIYPVVFTGSDLGQVKEDNKMSTPQFKDFINRNMGWLRGSSRGLESAPDIIEAENFGEVLNKFKNEFNASGFEFYVPKGYSGKRIRMVFTGEVGQTGKIVKTELIGDFINKGNKYFLKNIEMRNGLSSGIKFKNGKKIDKLTATNYKNKKDELAIFRLEKPEYNNHPYYIINHPDLIEQFVEQSIGPSDRKSRKQVEKKRIIWVKNSEYFSQSSGSIDTYFILVFDASKSLKGEGFADERKTAIEMIKVIRGSALESETKVDVVNTNKTK